MITVLDGPMGTQLAARGVDTHGRSWSARAVDVAPEAVLAVHQAYAEAGADVHTTATFRTTRRAVGGRWRDLTRRAVGLAQAAARPGQRVAGSVAPLEDCYRPDLSPDNPGPEHRDLAQALAADGVDLLLCETFSHVPEALAAVAACVATGLETWLSLTACFCSDLLTPAEVRQGARAAIDLGASAVLINCVPANDTQRFVDALVDLGVPFGAYANAGTEHDGVGWSAVPDGPARYADLARGWIAGGATLIGTCCGTGPEHVRAVCDLAHRSRVQG